MSFYWTWCADLHPRGYWASCRTLSTTDWRRPFKYCYRWFQWFPFAVMLGIFRCTDENDPIPLDWSVTIHRCSSTPVIPNHCVVENDPILLTYYTFIYWFSYNFSLLVKAKQTQILHAVWLLQSKLKLKDFILFHTFYFSIWKYIYVKMCSWCQWYVLPRRRLRRSVTVVRPQPICWSRRETFTEPFLSC